jgi:ABC-type glycerol-3-phosphate transport system permease component
MSILAAYALAVLRFRFREHVFALAVISFIGPEGSARTTAS